MNRNCRCEKAKELKGCNTEASQTGRHHSSLVKTGSYSKITNRDVKLLPFYAWRLAAVQPSSGETSITQTNDAFGLRVGEHVSSGATI